MDDPSKPISANDVELLLAQRDWVRRLARSLVADEHRAADVAQESWLAALRHPPRHAQNLRSWLSTLVRNTARSIRRSERRREERETELARDRDSSRTTDALERAELLRELVTTVLALREPYKSVLVLTYFESLAPSAVAERLGIPASTVRTQIQRGLSLVKSELERKHPRERWLSGLVVLARKPIVPIAAGGVVIMSFKIKVALVAIVLACMGAWTWHRLAPVSPEAYVAVAPVLSETRMESKPIAMDSPAGESRSAIVGDTSAKFSAESNEGSLRVEAVCAKDDAPAANIGVLLRVFDAVGRSELRESVTGSDGTALFEHLRPGGISISLDHGGREHVDVKRGERAVARLVIPLGVNVRGRVVDPEGKPVSSASIWLMYDKHWQPGRAVTTSGADGRFEIEGVALETQIGARKAGHAPSFLRVIDGRPNDTIDITLVMRGRGASVNGVVSGADSKPIEGAHVQIREAHTYVNQLPDGSRGGAPAARRIETDAEGRFRADDVSAGELECVGEARNFASRTTSIVAHEGETTQVEIQLGRGSLLRGRVLDADRIPAPDVFVQIDPGFIYMRTDADGNFRVDALAPGEWHVLADGKSRGRARASVEMRDGEEAVWNVTLDKGVQLGGRLVDEDERPLEGWYVWVKPSKTHFKNDAELHARMEWREDFGQSKTDANGRFALCNLLDWDSVLEVRRPDEPGSHPVLILEDVKPGRDDLVVRVHAADMPSAFVQGTLMGADGKPVGDAELDLGMVPLRMSGSVSIASSDREAGKFRIGPLPPGTYRLDVHAKGFVQPDLGAFNLTRGEEHDCGTIRLVSGGSVSVKVKRSDGSAIGMPVLQLYREKGFVAQLVLLGDRARAERLEAGHYRLFVRETEASRTGPPKLEIDVDAGKETTVELELGAAPK